MQQLPLQQWKDLVIFTALLMGADFQKQNNFWVANDGVSYGFSRFDAALKWLWKKGYSVRKDGSIYQSHHIFTESNK